MKYRYRAACAAAALACGLALTNAPARANLDTVIGTRTVVPDKPMSDCSARAKSALTTVMNSAFEAGQGSGQWIGVVRVGGSASAAAVIECHPLDAGYTASFTCSVQVPPNPDTASGLCTKLSTAFNAATAAAAGGATWY
ncbi:MAG: hypothetical protein KGN02_06485 [bacterium]|nr:hypothetical protein [bacterium]